MLLDLRLGEAGQSGDHLLQFLLGASLLLDLVHVERVDGRERHLRDPFMGEFGSHLDLIAVFLVLCARPLVYRAAAVSPTTTSWQFSKLMLGEARVTNDATHRVCMDALADKSGRGRKRTHDAVIRHRIAAAACSEPPASVGTHWSVRTLAQHRGVSASLVQSVPRAESIQPHRSRYWKHSEDPEFEPKMLAIIGLYLHAPDHAVVLSVDEKTSVQAPDRTQPRLPMKPHRIERLSHEYKRRNYSAC